MDIPIYENKLPIVDENVLVIFTEYKDTHIEAELIEYQSIKGMMIYEDATRKKKVYDWKKEIPLTKITIAKVEEIFSDTYVKLSTAYFDQRMDPVDLRKHLMKPFQENKVLLNIIKKVCKSNNLDFNTFWSQVIYKINNEKRNDDVNESLLNYISENSELFNDTIKEYYPDEYEKIIEDYEKYIVNKISKIQSKFSLITKNSIEDIKTLLKLACENNNDWVYTVKYECTPIYLLESSSENSTEENHETFLNFLEENSKTYNINYSKTN